MSPTFSVKITKATVLASATAADTIVLDTDLPSAIYPFTGQAFFTLQVASGRGEEYIRKHFKEIPIQVISIS